MNYAIIRTGGKQYRVSPGDVIDVERLSDREGPTVELTDVLAMSRDGKVTVGTPTVEGVKVRAEIRQQIRGDKITVLKYKRKTHYRRKLGHRQMYSRLEIQDIEVEGDKKSAKAQKGKADGTQKSRRKQPQRTRQQRPTSRRKTVRRSAS
jgi:large subunit ribosomal protein L21